MVMLIMQSGGASAIEGIFYRLPMITMPIGFDQERAISKVEKIKGYRFEIASFLQVDIAAFLVEKGAAEDLSIFADSDEIYNVATRVIHEPR